MAASHSRTLRQWVCEYSEMPERRRLNARLQQDWATKLSERFTGTGDPSVRYPSRTAGPCWLTLRDDELSCRRHGGADWLILETHSSSVNLDCSTEIRLHKE